MGPPPAQMFSPDSPAYSNSPPSGPGAFSRYTSSPSANIFTRCTKKILPTHAEGEVVLGPVELVGVELLGEVRPGVDLEGGVAPVGAGAGQPHVQVGLHRVHAWAVTSSA